MTIGKEEFARPSPKRVITGISSEKVTIVGLVLLGFLLAVLIASQTTTPWRTWGTSKVASWFFFLGGILPFPGIKSILTLLAFNIGLGIFRGGSRTILFTRTGLLFIALGILISQATLREYELELVQGTTTSMVSLPNEWELLIRADSHTETFPIKKLKQDDFITHAALGSLFIAEVYLSCRLYQLTEDRDILIPSDGTGAHPDLPGISLMMFRPSSYRDAPRVKLQAEQHPFETILYGQTPVVVRMRRTRVPLSFSLGYPSPETSLRSHPIADASLKLTKGATTKTAHVGPGRPAQYGPYMIYLKEKVTTGAPRVRLRIVRNPVQALPYVGMIILTVGLIIGRSIPAKRDTAASGGRHAPA